MKNQVQFLHSNYQGCLDILKNQHLLIDTNFLIDAINYPKAFNNVILELQSIDSAFVSNKAVQYEFVKGSRSLEEYKKFTEFYDNIIQFSLKIDLNIEENVFNLSKILLKRARYLSYVDITLLSTLMKYCESGLYLLSKDRSDIVTSLFSVKVNLIIDTGDNNCFYSIYSFDKKQYSSKLNALIKTNL